MSAPYVTGVAGLVKSINPSLTGTEIKKNILGNVDPIPQLSGKLITGGRLNAKKACLAAISNPKPTIISLSPNSVIAKGPTLTLAVIGQNFVSGCVVRYDGSDRVTTFVSSTQVTAQIPASDIAAAGSHTITVFNPAPGGGLSNGLTFTVNPQQNPVIGEDQGWFLVHANVDGASVYFDNQLEGQITQGTLIIPVDTTGTPFKTYTVSMAGYTTFTGQITEYPSKGQTVDLYATLNPQQNPVPAIQSITPSTVNAGGPAMTLAVIGQNYVSGCVVRYDGSDRVTTFVSSTQVTAQIPASDIASAGSHTITVFNPAPGGGQSNGLTFTVNQQQNPVPAIQSLNPSAVNAGGPAMTLAVIGQNFVSGCVVRYDGSDRSTTFVSSTQVTAQIPASDIAAAGSHTITVFNPAPGGGISNARQFSVRNKGDLLSAEFASDKTQGIPPLSIQFSDLSQGKPTAWFWSFGDGSYSREQSPGHTYNEPGQYQVRLFIKNEYGSSTLERNDYITCL